MKECSSCKELMEEDKFQLCRNSKSGLQSSCKKCRSKASKKYVDRMSIPIVYSIVNNANGRAYIGASINGYLRIRRHKINLRNGSMSNKYLQADFIKYGEKSFSFKIIEKPDLNDLANRELFHIQENIGNCYNIDILNGHRYNFADIKTITL